MENSKIYRRTGDMIEELNLYDDLKINEDYILVRRIYPHELIPEYFSVYFHQIHLEKDHPGMGFMRIENYKLFRELPGGKKQAKSKYAPYVERFFQVTTIKKITRGKRPHWTDDYSHLGGALSLCEESSVGGLSVIQGNYHVLSLYE